MKISEIIRTQLGEMANLYPPVTGIEPVIHCCPKGGAKHECRVKVSNTPGTMSDNNFSIAVKDLSVIGHCTLSADQLESVMTWIFRNRYPIVKFWEGRLSAGLFLKQIKNIKEK